MRVRVHARAHRHIREHGSGSEDRRTCVDGCKDEDKIGSENENESGGGGGGGGEHERVRERISPRLRGRVWL